MTMLDVTQRDSEPEVDSRARGGDASTRRGGVDDTDGVAGSTLRSTIAGLTDGDQWTARFQRLANCQPYTAQPASIASVVEHTRRGGWIPGEHPWWWEAPGYAWGYLVAIPGSAVGYAFLWLLQRPAWLLFVAFVLTMLTKAWG